MSTTVIATTSRIKVLPDQYKFTATAELHHHEPNSRPNFSVQGELRNLRRRGDNQIEACGCMHNEVRKHFPELEPVILVHLADDDGTPMHADANGRYWLGLSRWGDGRGMSPRDDFGRIPVETHPTTGLEWSPVILASHWQISEAEARAIGDYVHADPNPSEAVRYWVGVLRRNVWPVNAARALATIKGEELPPPPPRVAIIPEAVA